MPWNINHFTILQYSSFIRWLLTLTHNPSSFCRLHKFSQFLQFLHSVFFLVLFLFSSILALECYKFALNDAFVVVLLLFFSFFILLLKVFFSHSRTEIQMQNLTEKETKQILFGVHLIFYMFIMMLYVVHWAVLFIYTS